MDVGSITRQVFAILLVFGLLGFTLWKLRRGGSPAALLPPWRRNAAWGSGKVRAMESVERLSLTPQHALHLVRVQGRQIVVATHPQGCTLLGDASESNTATGAGA
ncbi:MAG TPA: flagellar biosynthetic protein FliO [Bryobacteraceae bacterium]|jgi:flagellar biogenesis protein FliO